MIKNETIKKYGIYNIILLFFFLADSVFEISLPIYLLSLGHSFGEIGVMVATFSVGIVIFRFLVSMHSDKVGRKVYVVLSLVGSAGICFILPFGNSIMYFMVILLARGACRGAFLAVRAPIVRDISTEHERGKMLGLVSAFSTVGSALGGGVAGWLYYERHVWILFFIIGALYLLAAFIALFFLSENKVRPDNVSIVGRKRKIRIVSRIKEIPNAIKLLCGVNFVQNVVTPPLWSMILPIYFTSVIGMSMKLMGFIFTLDNILGVPSSILGGIWADKQNSKRKCIWLSFICAAVAFLLPIQKEVVGFTILILLFMTIFSINSPMLEKIESMSARDKEAGFDLGLISASVSLGNSLGSIIFGIIIDVFGFVWAYILIGVGYIMMCLLLSKIEFVKQTNSHSNLSES